MVLDIKPYYDVAYTCYEVAVCTVLNWAGIDSGLLFYNYWNFNYFNDKQLNLIGEKIDTGEGDLKENLEKIYHIKMIEYLNMETVEYIKLIQDELMENRPILIVGDGYYIPWDKIYLKSHYGHIFLVKGMDSGKRELYCSDPYRLKDDLVISYEQLAQICSRKSAHNAGCLAFRGLKHHVSLEQLDWKALLKNTIEPLKANASQAGLVEQLKAFKNDLLQNLDLAKEYKGATEIWQPPLAYNLANVFYARKKFATALYCLGEQCQVEDLYYMAQEFQKISEIWERLKNRLIKCYLSSDYNARKLRINANIDEIIEKEEKSICLIEDLIQGQRIMTKQGHENLNNDAGYIVDIEEYKNNKGFTSYETSTVINDFNDKGLSFSTEFFPVNRSLFYKNIVLDFSDVIFSEYDNIRCLGQKINCHVNEYKKILLIGCSTQGMLKDTFIFEYQNGKEDGIPIRFSDWFDPAPNTDETVVWQGKLINSNPDNKDLSIKPGHIFGQELELNDQMKLKSIILPRNKAIHLFKIVLLR